MSGATLYDFPLTRIDGASASLADYRGHVLLIVNVASECGLTPQYDGLERLYERYADRGLVVLGFPANEFGAQEPGSNEQIQEFCRTHFGVKFPMFAKLVVKGEGQHPLYQWLTESMPNADGGRDVSWNFEKFLVGRDGSVVGRFSPKTTPDDPALVAAIEAQLAR